MSPRFALFRDRRARAVLAIAFFLGISSCLAALVAISLATLTATADSIDDDRAVHAADAAQKALLKQIAGTVRDNAYWDDAYENIRRGRLSWTIENWGAASKDYPLYDTAIVIGPHDGSFMAYHDGVVLPDGPRRYFDASFQEIVDEARQTSDADRLPARFIRSRDGIAYVAAAPIQVTAGMDGAGKGYLLLFAKHLNPKALAEFADNAGLNGMELNERPVEGRLSFPLENASGDAVAFLTWLPDKPGTKSFHSIKPLVALAAVGFILFFAAILASGHRIILGLRRDETMSRQRALRDSLTGLANRAGLSEVFDEMRGAGEHRRICLYLLDLDGFKSVNDLWGHQVGDALLAGVAKRIREIAPRDAVAARLGGDEFAIIHAYQSDDQSWEHAGRMIREELSRPFEISGRVIEVGCSMGQVASGAHDNIFELLRKADIALYKAKDGGRGMTVCFRPDFDAEQLQHAVLEQDLKASLARDAIEVVFQPLIDAQTRQMRGVEALARWKPPGRDYVSPEVFIPLAERAGLIEELGLQVLRKALLSAAEWPGLGLSVNASPVQLRSPNFVGQVKALLDEVRFDAARLTIEITEGVLISNPEQAERAMGGLRAMGIKIALDDFGTGYASIGTLRKFRFDRLKIDRSLIAAIDDDENGVKILQATIALADALNIPVTAEGIEREQQAMTLKLCGCDKLQGYLFSKPVAAETIAEQLGQLMRGTGSFQSTDFSPRQA
jgi:diguanylate cyclase (GGDEF)-like protein